MPKRNRRRKPKPTRPGQRKGSRRSSARPPHPEETDLVRDVTEALESDEPVLLLGMVSALLASLEPPGRSPFDTEPEPDLPTRDELIATFLDVDLPETSALLTVVAAFSRDDMLRRRVHREIAARAHVLPGWLVELHRATPSERATEVVHVLGDGDNVNIGVHLTDGRDLTAVVYIDHNLGTVVKDAFVVPGTAHDLAEQMLMIAADQDTQARDIDLADARARITEAIEVGAITFPPLESETWPACRPLVEWAVAMLPEGGTGYTRPEWTETDCQELAQRFLATPFGAALDHPEHADLLETLLWFGTDYGPGDPLRWSTVAVEILLLDWIPRKIVADVPYLAKAPEVLRAFIRFSHCERGIRAELTAETLDAVDAYEPEYQRLIRSPRPQGPAALFAAMGAPWLDELGDDAWDDEDPGVYKDIVLDSLRRAVGGEAALDAIDTSPLPDEPFSWDAIPVDVHERVGEVLALVDRCCNELLHPECRTACRRFLAAAAAGDPEIFRRRGKANTAAAAVCWVIGKANSLFDYYGPRGGLMVKDLLGHFDLGQGSASQRAGVLMRAAGIDSDQYGEMNLESPRYLTSARRAEILELRDRYRSVGE